VTVRAPVVVIGAGGHAKVCVDVLRARFEPLACLDPGSEAEQVLGVPVLRDEETALDRLRAQGVGAAFIALGDNATRERIGAAIRAMGFALVNAISPAAVISPSARLGAGLLVMPGAVVNAEAEIADLAIVNTNATVEHDCRLGTATHLGPGAILAGGVSVGARAFLGAGSAVKPGLTIGADAVVGLGAAVVRDIAPGAVVAGTPARLITYREGAA
jgi:UDP-perosamine 4-acetyltransferase